MRTFVIQFRSGESLRFRADHLYQRDGVIELVVWDDEADEGRAIALFPLPDVSRAFAEEALAGDDPRPTPPA